MALPLPQVVANVPIQGGIMADMSAQNALSNQLLQNKILAAQAQYAPLSALGDASLKIAQARLIGPQFLAQMMRNPDVLANMTPDQRSQALQQFYQAGTGTNNILGNMIQNAGANNLLNSGGGLLGWITNKLTNKLNTNPVPSGNAMGNAMGNAAGGTQSFQAAPNAMNTSPFLNNIGSGSAPSAQSSGFPMASAASKTMPQNLSASLGDQQGNSALSSPDQFFQNVAQAQGLVSEGQESGKLRADTMKELGEQYQQGMNNMIPLNHLMQMVNTPDFANMRSQIPFYQDKQLQALSKIGTPQQQKMIGDFITSAKQAVANTINSFHGRILDKEVGLANQMKINENDTWATMLGKLSALASLQQEVNQRNYATNQIMANQHVNYAQAVQMADQAVNGDAIRSQINDTLNPKPTSEDINYMAQKYNITPQEVIEKLKARGIM